MATRSRPLDATGSSSRYHTAHCGVITDRHGKFERFLRKLDAAHLKNGYWRFTTQLDEQRAYTLGHQSPESILSAVHCGDGTYDDIQLRWVPGSIDGNTVGPLSGNAAQHLRNIHEARRFLGKSLAIMSNVPLYPVEPRMKGFWDAKRAVASTANTIVGRSTPAASPLPSPHVGASTVRSHAPPAGMLHEWNAFSPPVALVPSPAVVIGSRTSTAPSRSPARIPSAPAHQFSPSPSSSSPYLSRSRHAASSRRSEAAGGAVQHPIIIPDSGQQEPTARALHNHPDLEEISMDEFRGLNSRTGSSHSFSTAADHSRHSAHLGDSSQSRDDINSLQDLSNNERHHENHSSGPSRPDVMAGHPFAVAGPPPLTHRPRAASTSPVSSVMPLADSFNILGFPSSLHLSVSQPLHVREATGSQFQAEPNTPTQLCESNNIICEDPPPMEFDQSPDTDSLPAFTPVDLHSTSSVTITSPREVVDLTEAMGQSSIERSNTGQVVGGRSHPLEHQEAAGNDIHRDPKSRIDDRSEASVKAASQRQPTIEVMYPDLPCMDCGKEAGQHASDCYIGNLQPMENFTILDYRNLAEATKRFDPGPWTEHQGPPPDPETESVEDQIQGIAEVVRNEDSYNDDAWLHPLPDDMMVFFWMLKTSSNVQMVDEFDHDSGIGESDSD